MAAALFDPQLARLQVDLVVRHEQLRRAQAVVVEHGANRAAAVVHETLWLHEPDVFAVQIDAAVVRIEFLLVTKAAAVLSRERIHEPEPRVVQGAFVLFPGIPESGNDA